MSGEGARGRANLGDQQAMFDMSDAQPAASADAAPTSTIPLRTFPDDILKPAAPNRAKSPHAGHRHRLRERLAVGGADAMPDYELLEMVLFRAKSRGDTKPLAKALIGEFGSFAGVVQASDRRLSAVNGVGPAAIAEIRLIRAAALRLARAEVMDKPVLSSWSKVLDYCHSAMAFSEIEQFRILFLDKKNRLIADEVQQEGTVDHTPVYVREVIKRALELSSTAIVLVHNHPSGDATPSRADVDMTKQIVMAGKPLGVAVHDHIIVAREGHASFRNMGLI